MDKTDLKPGYYQLSCDVKNPHPDKRKTREITAAPTWKKGTRVAIRQGMSLIRDNEKPYLECEFTDVRYPSLTARPEWNDLFKAIAPALEPTEMDLHLTLHKVRHENGSKNILDKLVRNGDISLAQIEAAAAALEQEYEDEDEDEKHKAEQG